MKQMQILMGYGANSACAPVALFVNKEEALAVIVPILGEPTDCKGFLRWEIVYEKYEYAEPRNQKADEKHGDNNRKVEAQWRRKMKKLFKSYYGGCGDCDIVLEPITVGKLKTFVWDLD